MNRRKLTDLVEVVGVAAVVAGVALLFGLGVALIVGGIASVVVGYLLAER